MLRLWQVYRKYWKRWGWGCVMLLLTNVTALMIPQLFSFAIDGIQNNVPLHELKMLAVMLLLLAIGGGVFRTLSRIHIFYAARDVEMDLRCSFYQHLTEHAPSFFQNHPTGDLMSRATGDLPQVRLLLGPGLLNTVNTLFAYAGAVPLMLWISPKLTLLAFMIYPFAMFGMRKISRQLFLRTKEQQQGAGLISNFVQENLAGAYVIKAFGAEKEQLLGLERLNKQFYETNIRLSFVRSGMFRLVGSIAGVSILIMVYFGAQDVLQNKLSLGQLVALIEYMAILSWPTFALGWVLSMWQRGNAAMTRINEVLYAERTIDSGHLAEIHSPHIEFKHFTLELGSRKILDNVSFQLLPSQTLGFVGQIGAGKSMLVRALLRQIEIARGQIFINHQDILDYDLQTLRSLFGYVPQNPGLFSKTLFANVAFGVPNATEEQVLEALRAAAFSKDLQYLPQGLQTQVGERGVTLSGGQKQRVAIARALLLDPPILILDDALSSVDTETEKAILDEIKKRRKGRSTIVVAHRLSAVQHANQIIVLTQGQIAERGTHEELLRNQGLYATMAHRQELAKRLEMEVA